MYGSLLGLETEGENVETAAMSVQIYAGRTKEKKKRWGCRRRDNPIANFVLYIYLRIGYEINADESRA